MARTGKITLYEGVSKATKKPYTAIKLEIGTWSKLVFTNSDQPTITSQFEMDYIKNYLSSPETSEEVKAKAEETGKKGLFNS